VAEAEDAIAALDAFPPSPARDALTALAQREIERSR
jgi:geranylgeranyl pyrophosphate synthase